MTNKLPEAIERAWPVGLNWNDNPLRSAILAALAEQRQRADNAEAREAALREETKDGCAATSGFRR